MPAHPHPPRPPASFLDPVAHRRPTPTLLSPDALDQRLVYEAERAARYGRPLSVMAILPGPEAHHEALAHALQRTLRRVDLVGLRADGALIALLPESVQVRIPLRRAAEALRRLDPEVRVGAARCPQDGLNADLLCTVAERRARTGKAPPEAEGPARDPAIVAVDPRTQRLFNLVRDLAVSDLPVLILGETGVGKEVVASALHRWSARTSGPFTPVNCAALPETLLEGELFGHLKGAFSGAVADRAGLVEASNGGTLFLDEIAEAAPRVQAKLLRVLEARCVRRVGSHKEQPVDIRLVAATHRDPEAEIAAGHLRQDLYYRLGAAVIEIPPLRARPLDVPPLARRFLADACDTLGREPPELTEEAVDRLMGWSWPGNVRELRHLMARVATLCPDDLLTGEALGRALRTGGRLSTGASSAAPSHQATPDFSAAPSDFKPLAEEIKALEQARIEQALEATGGVRKDAAALIEMPLRTFVARLKTYGINP